MSGQRYVEMVEPLAEGEEVLAAGVFQPRGTSGAMGAVGGGGKGIGGLVASVGMVEAGHVAAAAEHEPRWTIVGVTPTRVLAFEGRAHGTHWEPGVRYAVFDRTNLAVTTHNRVSVRVLELRDTATGERLELETMRVGPAHGGEVVHLLARDGAHDS